MSFRINSQQIFLTYSQANSLEKEEVIQFFKDINHNGNRVGHLLVAVEAHEDGGRHFHIYIKFERKANIRDGRFFDIRDQHPNIQGVRSTKAVLDYCKKDGDYTSLQRRGEEWVEWNQSIKRTWGELFNSSTTTEEYLSNVREHFPRDYALSYERLKSMAEQHFKPDKEEFVSTFKKDDFLTVRELDDWVEKNIDASQG